MAVNHRENMLRAISGRATERLPWVSRLDLWYRANKLAGTLPEAHRDSTLIELVDALDIGYHAIVPDFQDLRGRDDDIDRVLGVYKMFAFFGYFLSL